MAECTNLALGGRGGGSGTDRGRVGRVQREVLQVAQQVVEAFVEVGGGEDGAVQV